MSCTYHRYAKHTNFNKIPAHEWRRKVRRIHQRIQNRYYRRNGGK